MVFAQTATMHILSQFSHLAPIFAMFIRLSVFSDVTYTLPRDLRCILTHALFFLAIRHSVGTGVMPFSSLYRRGEPIGHRRRRDESRRDAKTRDARRRCVSRAPTAMTSRLLCRSHLAVIVDRTAMWSSSPRSSAFDRERFTSDSSVRTSQRASTIAEERSHFFFPTYRDENFIYDHFLRQLPTALKELEQDFLKERCEREMAEHADEWYHVRIGAEDSDGTFLRFFATWC